MTKPVLYLETTVISYYTSRPSLDVVIAGHQAVTVQWWEWDLPKFEAVVSQVVLDEIARGDPELAARRLAAVAGMNVLELSDEVEALASDIFLSIVLPQTARADALHLALATWHGVDYLASWNCRHIASARVRRTVR